MRRLLQLQSLTIILLLNALQISLLYFRSYMVYILLLIGMSYDDENYFIIYSDSRPSRQFGVIISRSLVQFPAGGTLVCSWERQFIPYCPSLPSWSGRSGAIPHEESVLTRIQIDPSHFTFLSFKDRGTIKQMLMIVWIFIRHFDAFKRNLLRKFCQTASYLHRIDQLY